MQKYKGNRLLFIILFLASCEQKHTRDNTLSNDAIGQNNLINLSFGFYPVFELSPCTIGVQIGVTNETETKSVFDSMLEQITLNDTIQHPPFADKLKNCYYYDTTGAYILLKNDNLDKLIKGHLLNEYFIYGTKGVKKCKVKDVVFGGDECRSSILAFTIDKFDTIRYGHPLLCSPKLVKLHFNTPFPAIEKQINTLIAKPKADYTDSMQTKVFASIDSFYFTYSDDFLWGKIPDDKVCLFPCRHIFINQNNNALKLYWVSSLDLIGVPCD